MFSRVKVYNLPPVLAEHDKHIEHSEPGGGDGRRPGSFFGYSMYFETLACDTSIPSLSNEPRTVIRRVRNDMCHPLSGAENSQVNRYDLVFRRDSHYRV